VLELREVGRRTHLTDGIAEEAVLLALLLVRVRGRLMSPRIDSNARVLYRCRHVIEVHSLSRSGLPSRECD